MATEILRPQDCLSSAHNFHSFSPQSQSHRRKSRPLRTNQTPKTKHGRPNRRSSSSSPSTSPPPTPPLSTSPVHDGFRLLRRGEPFQPGSEAAPPKAVPPSRRSETKTKNQSPPQKKNQSQSDRVASRPEPTMTPPPPPLPPPPMNLSRAGSDDEGFRYAGLNCSLSAPAPECVPKPGFLTRSTSVGPSSSSHEDVASRTLRGLLKLDFM